MFDSKKMALKMKSDIKQVGPVFLEKSIKQWLAPPKAAKYDVSHPENFTFYGPEC